MSKITQLDEIVSFDGKQYYTIVARNGENKKVKITNLLVISLENFEVLETITADKISDWNNKSNFNGDYNSLTNKPSMIGLVTQEYIDDNCVTKEEYESLLDRVEALEENDGSDSGGNGGSDSGDEKVVYLLDAEGNYLLDSEGNLLIIIIDGEDDGNNGGNDDNEDDGGGINISYLIDSEGAFILDSERNRLRLK